MGMMGMMGMMGIMGAMGVNEIFGLRYLRRLPTIIFFPLYK